MKALFLTNEYPPHVHGGAGLHVEYLWRELAKTMLIDILHGSTADKMRHSVEMPVLLLKVKD